MTLALFVMMGVSSAQTLPTLPAVHDDTVPGECHQSIPIRSGKPFPTSLQDAGGLARCSAVAEPLTSYAHLLQMKEHATLVHTLYEADMLKVSAERDFYRSAADIPLHREPWFVAVTSSALVASVLVTYSWATGGSR